MAPKNLISVLLCCAAGVELLCAQPPTPPNFRTRGIHYFAGRYRCPLADTGTRGANDCNRLVLDDDHSNVTVDPRTKRIVFTNTHRYSLKQDVGELLFLANATTAKGETVPVGV